MYDQQVEGKWDKREKKEKKRREGGKVTKKERYIGVNEEGEGEKEI